jgi:CSLREA domain-containing protein
MKYYLLTIVSILFLSAFTFGATFTVNSSADTSDANPADNLCLDTSGNCSLRAAVEQANASASNDEINFAANISSIPLTTQITITNNGSLTITGRGANLLNVTNTSGNGRAFQSNSATLTITDLTVSGNRIPSINTTSGVGMLVNGGAVNLQRVVFNDNRNLNGRMNAADGGGINFIGGNHVIENSTFSNNQSSGNGGGIANNGAAITISNSTFSGNTGGHIFGGGIYNAGDLTLRNDTISNNTASAGCISACTGYGGGIAHLSGALSFTNTIVSGNLTLSRGMAAIRPEIHFAGGTFTSLGNNFVGDSAGDSIDTGGFMYLPSDIRDIPPQLATLGNYGGTTPTRALLSSSPAINAGNDANAPPTDQRGVARVGASDIGAFEFNGLNLSISGRVTSDGTNGLSGVTVTLSGSSAGTVTTNANGEYSFAALVEGGNYTVTPTLANVTFSPLNATFNNLLGSQTANFRTECVYSISPTSPSVPASGGSLSINVTTVAGCAWTSTSNADWIFVDNGTGTGSGTATFTILPNTGAVRTGTITVAGQTVTVTQAALPNLSINNVSLVEGNSGTNSFVFTVTLSAASAQTVTVNYATVNGTATPPTDYQGISGSLSFAPGETSKTITVLVNGDTTVEPNETFTVNLSNATNANLANAQGTGTIRNDDGATAARTAYDFDGDGRSDIALFRPSNGNWYELRSQSGGFFAQQFGQSGDLIAPADYDGDGKTDIAVWRGTVPGAGNFAYFYIFNSADNSFRPVQFGATGDVPVAGDWDADGKADLAVYREATTAGGQSYFYYRPSSQPGVDFRAIPWGTNGDKPVMGDFDGDSKLDAAVFRPSNATWYVLRSTNSQLMQQSFGLSTDIPVPADYDGNGISDFAIFRPSTGYWYTSTNPAINYGAVLFGTSGDMPVPADYDGDGKADVAVFRPSNGAWYLQRSTTGFTGIQFGQVEDKPSPNAYIR